ncbi:transcription factor with AP2 domain(s), putative [Plasmodium sp. gorilla clade G2]|uniref:transcription factor with AP2 domain(s), putative n=1 Tax=Plasmodium sp. gorilla clade G2 TaxID=880535 RepID=UPI000D2DB689|nr:transcription factor with AP2 domain(s), putative [Plasmodium sp. gorilla clade G2]SOV20213.1 transcription factor with AP2 domain(s), putative [Plasmodium sp. gorilla clade G2]
MESKQNSVCKFLEENNNLSNNDQIEKSVEKDIFTDQYETNKNGSVIQESDNDNYNTTRNEEIHEDEDEDEEEDVDDGDEEKEHKKDESLEMKHKNNINENINIKIYPSHNDNNTLYNGGTGMCLIIIIFVSDKSNTEKIL